MVRIALHPQGSRLPWDLNEWNRPNMERFRLGDLLKSVEVRCRKLAAGQIPNLPPGTIWYQWTEASQECEHRKVRYSHPAGETVSISSRRNLRKH